MAIVILIFTLNIKLLFVLATTIFFAIAMYETGKMLKISMANIIAICSIFILLSIYLCYSSFSIQLYIPLLISILWIIAIPTITIFNLNINKNLLLLIVFSMLVISVYNINLLHAVLGSLQLISIMAISWIADIGAYFIGKKFGKYKLAIKISPNKTIEGSIGGLLLVILYFFILHYTHFAFYITSYFNAINLAIIFVGYSILGDLFESYIKRLTNVKDSGSILPGHGGVFDRIDSLVAVLAIANLVIM